MPLHFNKTADLKLLQLVKENQILYNTKHPNYIDFDAREVVWQKIGDALHRPARACKSRWINIRDMMRRKVRERHRNPSQHTYKYKYEDQLTFMFPYFKAPDKNEDYQDFINTDCEVEIPEVFEDNSIAFESESKPIFRSRQEDASKDFPEAVFQDLNPTDPLDVFLLTIGSTLRNFSPYYLNQAKSKIFQVVQDYELKQIVNRDDIPGSSNDQ